MLNRKTVCHAQVKNTLQKDHCLLVFQSVSFMLLLNPPPLFIYIVLSSFLPSFLIRMGHVLVVRGRRRCPSVAASQKRRSAVLPTVYTLWWVSYCVT